MEGKSESRKAIALDGVGELQLSETNLEANTEDASLTARQEARDASRTCCSYNSLIPSLNGQQTPFFHSTPACLYGEPAEIAGTSGLSSVMVVGVAGDVMPSCEKCLYGVDRFDYFQCKQALLLSKRTYCTQRILNRVDMSARSYREDPLNLETY